MDQPQADADIPYDLIKDGSDAQFMADVMEVSKTVPVIVDFWAPWCGPCKQLGPALENVVRKAAGKVRMVKINVDENPGISGQLQVRSIPAVFAFKDGKPVDAFNGALPESQLQAFVDKLTGDMDIGKEVKQLVARAENSLELGDMGGAAQDFAAALGLEQTNPEALGGMARVYLANDDIEGAKGVLEMVTPEDQDHQAIAGVRAAIDLAQNAPSDDDMAPLRATVTANPADMDARFTLSEALSGKGDVAGAMDELFVILETELNWKEQKARKMLLKLFEVAGATSELTAKGRRRLSSLLFR
ncbi:FIG000875: Thioredoxin domain-containing protein EC-YbbN [hydrothermal vent metagenome]|uniref:FIG000875: Thioredoxin domain-containing protein EC-YbbN n=1 Tax=hydrothermal vent metagenome TaxID=652676 RepID=A0A3B0RAB2_9ZZZZ